MAYDEQIASLLRELSNARDEHQRLMREAFEANAALRAELAAAKAARDLAQTSGVTTSNYWKQRADDMEAELAAAKARLSYVEANMRCDPDMGGKHKWWRWQPYPFPVGDTFLAAIDAAIGEKP